MDGSGDPIRFPVELAEALVHMRRLAGRRHGFVVARRATRRAIRRTLFGPDGIWAVIEQLSAADFHDGPLQDHHCADREVWVFGPLIEGRRMYLKVGFRRVPDGPESALVIWSYHEPRFPMKGRTP